MMRQLRMSELGPGQTGEVLSLSGESAMCRRLLDLGLVEGSRVSCVSRSLWGDPGAYAVCGAIIALRKTDCESVLLREVEP